MLLNLPHATSHLMFPVRLLESVQHRSPISKILTHNVFFLIYLFSTENPKDSASSVLSFESAVASQKERDHFTYISVCWFYIAS